MIATPGPRRVDLEALVARAQSLCFDRAQPVETPQPAPRRRVASTPTEEGIDPGLMTMIVDAVRDHYDACGAVILAIRQWREAKPERSLPRGHPRRPK